MKWICPKCKNELNDLKCQRCNFEFNEGEGVFDFTYSLKKQELAEDEYRRGRDTDLERIIRKKKGSVEYYKKFIEKKLNIGGRVLDLGAGFCWLGGALSGNDKVDEVWCSDVSKKALSIGKKITEKKGFKITGYVRSKAYSLPFQDNYFDVVVSSAFLHHVVSVPEVLLEIKRVVKPGGIYYGFLEPAISYSAKPLSWSRVKKAEKDHPGVSENVYTFSEWKELFKDYETSIVLTPPFREKWRNTWRIFKKTGLVKYLLFSNILIKVRF